MSEKSRRLLSPMSNSVNDKEKQIINEIHNFCKNECGIRESCAEDECVLFRIEKLIVGSEYYDS